MHQITISFEVAEALRDMSINPYTFDDSTNIDNPNGTVTIEVEDSVRCMLGDNPEATIRSALNLRPRFYKL